MTDSSVESGRLSDDPALFVYVDEDEWSDAHSSDGGDDDEPAALFSKASPCDEFVGRFDLFLTRFYSARADPSPSSCSPTSAR